MPKSMASSGLILQQKSPNDIRSFFGGLRGCTASVLTQPTAPAPSQERPTKAVGTRRREASPPGVSWCPAQPRSLLLGRCPRSQQAAVEGSPGCDTPANPRRPHQPPERASAAIPNHLPHRISSQ